MNTTTKTKTKITVRDLKVGDEIYYADGNQTVTDIEMFIDLDLRKVYDIYVEGVATPRRQPGRAPIAVMR